MPSTTAAPVLPHTFTHNGTEVLVLRRTGKDRKSKNGFIYPFGIGSVATAPDWSSEQKFGGGLHAWPWGFGIGEGSDFDANEDIWMILGCDPKDVVGELDQGWKCKFRTGTIRFEGKFKDALDQLRAGFTACIKAMAVVPTTAEGGKISAQSGDYSKSAQSGDYSKSAQSGDSSKSAQSGDYSKSAQSGDSSNSAQSGYSSKSAQSGYSSKSAQSGDSSNSAQSGDYSKSAQSGYSSNSAQSGYYSKSAQSGDSSNSAQSGDYSNSAQSGDSSNSAQSGDYSKSAQSGYYSKSAQSGDSSNSAQSGKDSVAAIAAKNGKVKTGDRGCFALAYWDEKTGWEFAVGKVGRDGIKADTWYVVENGKLVETTP